MLSVYKHGWLPPCHFIYKWLFHSDKSVSLLAIWLQLLCVHRKHFHVLSMNYVLDISRFFLHLFLFLSEKVRLLCVHARVDAGRVHCWKGIVKSQNQISEKRAGMYFYVETLLKWLLKTKNEGIKYLRKGARWRNMMWHCSLWVKN